MSKLKQDKIPMISEDSILKVATELGAIDGETNWKLVRERDELTRKSAKILWIEWDETGRYKDRHIDPAIGRSLIMSPFNQFFTWQTTAVTEITEQREDYVKFKTTNSTYELFKINNQSGLD